MDQDLDYATPGQEEQPARKPLRLWPILAVLGIYWAFRIWATHTELVMFVRFGTTFLSAVGVTLVFVAWWLISRRVQPRLKWPAFFAFIGGGVAAALLADKTLTAMSLIMLAPPWVVTAWAIWLLFWRRAPLHAQRIGLIAVLLMTWSFWTLVRFDGLGGEQQPHFSFRWSKTLEERYVEQLKKSTGAANRNAATSPVVLSPTDWPGFRGPRRDGVARGFSIDTDWPATGPKLAWRHPSGPGWSSFAVVGDRVYTQEQRGEQEIVLCLDARDGSEIWSHADTARFVESVSGAGPRATPTFADGRLYTMGGTGIVNCLDATEGRVIWSRDVRAAADAAKPPWGYSSSPLVTNGMVIVYGGGPGDKGFVACRADDGQVAWTTPAGPNAFSSAQLLTLGGREQVVLLSGSGVSAVDAASGAKLWDYAAVSKGTPRTIQPQAVGPSQLLIGSEMDIGTALLDVSGDGSTWTASKRWASKALKPSFNDFVVHGGHVYGFDGTVFCCIDLSNGKRVWRDGQYGHGQVVLLEDQSLLLIVSEEGDVILRPAKPDGAGELKRFKAVEGKVWAHPTITRNRLLVRSDQETACFEIAR
jgi:outer membrane protein assembly factor BamB